MPSPRERLLSIISRRQGDMLRDLAAYVAIPTGHNHTPGLDEFRGILVARLQKLGATVETHPGEARPDWLGEGGAASANGNVPPTVVCRRARAGRTRLLFAGHIDTVFPPAGAFRSLTIAPGGATATAIGPGVVDMKGGLITTITALEALEEAGIEVSWSFLLNSDEETGSYHSNAALRAEAARHDIGLAMEPALPGGGLAVARKGSGQFLIEAFGRSAHAGRDPEKGVSAVYALARCITSVEQLNDYPAGLSLNIGPVRGGTATNVVPDYACAWGNTRFVTPAQGEQVGARLEALATAEHAMPRISVKRSFNRPAKPLTPAVQTLADAARDAAESLGQTMTFAQTGGVCDGNILQDAGLPTIDTLGVRGGGLHTEQEWIELASLTERAALMAVLAARLSGHEV